jgi:hypothetical protein
MAPGTLDDTARRIVRARWVELRCFEVLGTWVVSTPEPEAKLAFARQSHHHAWHAELFERVLPVASGFDTDHHDEATPGWSTVFDVLARLASTADRLAGVYTVLLPTKLGEYERWLDDADPVRDAPLRRWLGFVVADERTDLTEGRQLVQALPGVEAAPGRAAVEAAVAAAGPLLD